LTEEEECPGRGKPNEVKIARNLERKNVREHILPSGQEGYRRTAETANSRRVREKSEYHRTNGLRKRGTFQEKDKDASSEP